MTEADREAVRPRSLLWLWGFWLFTAAAFAVFALSLSAPPLVERVGRSGAGVLLFVAGVHQLRVVAYKRATRPTYSRFGPNVAMRDRQTGWTAMILGVCLVASAIVGM